MKESINTFQFYRYKKFLVMILVLICCASKGNDTLTVAGYLNNSIHHDSTGLLTVLKQNTKLVFNPVFFSQNIGGLSLYLRPQFTLSKWYDNAVFTKLDKENLVLLDSSITQVNYLYGLDASHEFFATYSDKLGDTYINLIFDRTASVSKFSNDDVKKVSFLMNFEKGEGRYRNHYGFSKNNYSFGENGGITDSSSYIDALELTTFTVPVTLLTANNTVAMTDAHIGHELVLNYVDPEDTTRIDSTLPKYLHSIGYDASFQKEQYVYSMDKMDVDSGFYDTTFVSLNETWDSLGFSKLAYGVYYQLLDSVNRSLFKISYIGSKYDWTTLDKSFISGAVNIYKVGRISAGGKYNLEGTWKGGYDLYASHDVNIFSSWMSSMSYTIDNNLPGYFYMQYQGNHFNWSNSYIAVKNQSAKYSLYYKPSFTGIEAQVVALDNWVYLDTLSMPVQLQDRIQYVNLGVFNSFQSKYLSIYTKFSYQNSSSTVLRFPEYNFRNVFTYNFRLGRLKFTTGYMFSYFTSFVGLDYNPNLRRTYLQDDKQVGGIPILDVFATVKIGEANIFVKGENLLFESVSRAYFLYPNRPILPRYLRVGFSWTFKN